jgi:hypothetical protein
VSEGKHVEAFVKVWRTMQTGRLGLSALEHRVYTSIIYPSLKGLDS